MNYCTNCGTQLKQPLNYCGNCGTKQGDQEIAQKAVLQSTGQTGVVELEPYDPYRVLVLSLVLSPIVSLVASSINVKRIGFPKGVGILNFFSMLSGFALLVIILSYYSTPAYIISWIGVPALVLVYQRYLFARTVEVNKKPHAELVNRVFTLHLVLLGVSLVFLINMAISLSK